MIQAGGSTRINDILGIVTCISHISTHLTPLTTAMRVSYFYRNQNKCQILYEVTGSSPYPVIRSTIPDV